jgi:predicted transcriptional regulator
MSTSDVKPKFAITGRQIAAARELLDITQDGLSTACGIQKAVLARIEKGKVVPRESTLDKIREALELRGIVFTNGDKPSVTLDRSKAVIPV